VVFLPQYVDYNLNILSLGCMPSGGLDVCRTGAKENLGGQKNQVGRIDSLLSEKIRSMSDFIRHISDFFRHKNVHLPVLSDLHRLFSAGHPFNPDEAEP
jgi:hypothetical protein